MVKNNPGKENTAKGGFPEIRYAHLIIGVLLIAFPACFFYQIHNSIFLKQYGVECLAKAGDSIPEKKVFERKLGFRRAVDAYQEFRYDTLVWRFDTAFPKDKLVSVVYLPFTPAIAVVGKRSDSILALSRMNTFKKWIHFCVYSTLVALLLFILALNFKLLIFLLGALWGFADEKFKEI